MPRRKREDEILAAIREYLIGAVKQLEPITHNRLMQTAKCSRATFYKYVRKGSVINHEIEVACVDQEKYADSVKRGDISPGDDLDLRRRLKQAEEGDRRLLEFIARMTMNLIMYGVPPEVIQRAQREAMPHPNRSHSHAGRGRRRR